MYDMKAVEHYDEPNKPLTTHKCTQSTGYKIITHVTLKVSGDNMGIGRIGNQVGIRISHMSWGFQMRMKHDDIGIPKRYIDELKKKEVNMTDDTPDDREWEFSDEPQVPFKIPEDAVDYFYSYPDKDRFPKIEFTTACFKAAKYYLVRAQYEQYYHQHHKRQGDKKAATERKRLSMMFQSHANYCEMLGRTKSPMEAFEEAQRIREE